VLATEVAHRAGHGVAVLLKIHAHCIDEQADAANQRITDALRHHRFGQRHRGILRSPARGPAPRDRREPAVNALLAFRYDGPQAWSVQPE
jgi:hypothetical protein